MNNICAKIEDNKVTNIIVCSNLQWAIDNLGGEWVKPKPPVGIGYTYDSETNTFSPPIDYSYRDITDKVELIQWLTDKGLEAEFDLTQPVEDIITEIDEYYSKEI